MSDNRKEAEAKMAKAIFISGDCWLSVFDLLVPSQLGLGIALISHRFDFYVDEHFKTRKWPLKHIRIRSKIRENGTKEMEIGNFLGKPLPIPKMQLPRKVTGFQRIIIFYIDQNAIVFLRRFCQLFAACPINLFIHTNNDRILGFILRNICPMIEKNICAMQLSANLFHRLRHFVPSFLDDFPSLRVVSLCFDSLITQFPCDESADGQAVAKWLFTPRPDKVPKVLKCWLNNYDDDDDGDWNLATKIEAFKAAFASASSPVNFIVVIWVWPFNDSVGPFNLTNELTREQLALKKTNKYYDFFLLIRCPIAREADKWAKWEEEAIDWRICYQWNRVNIEINEEHKIGDGLLDETPGPSDQSISSRSE
ncbi:hypothetical protein niasHT_032492 [Heterodera trifolii]|uniref:Uncharacterized protein n=1 Tax=Heterodera trifolii TaxID=157864 RepID=A0ABD2ILA6_9BILA